MKFTSQEDIEAPIETVFERVTDFETFERSAIRRGAEVARVDQLAQPGVGMEWDARFSMRGKRREVQVRLSDFEQPEKIAATAVSPGLSGHFQVDLIKLSKNRTRMSVVLELTPQTLSARLLVQSMRLAKSNLSRRFKQRVRDFKADVEGRKA